MRYSNTERLGVIESDRVVTKDLQWIFREQPITDVGIDAIIEKADNGEPAGKFIAVQIKSGENNFYIKENSLTLYVSNIHYHYWLNLNIPIILIAYLPTKDEIFWQKIAPSSFIKTKKQWKLNIPKNQSLNINAKKNLEKILIEKTSTDIFYDVYKLDYESEFSEEYHFLFNSLISIKKINTTIDELGNYSRIFAKESYALAAKGYDGKSSQGKGAIKKQAKYFSTISKQLDFQANTFSSDFSEEILVIEKFIYNLKKLKTPITSAFQETLSGIPTNIDKAIHGITILKDTAKKLPKNPLPLKTSRKELVESLELLLSEFHAGKLIAERIIHTIGT